MSNLKLSAPWVVYYREIEALFGADPEITITIDEENYSVKLYVNNDEKAEALDKLLPAERTYGNVTVRTAVIPGNPLLEKKTSLFQTAFEGNPVFAFTKTNEGVFTIPLSYVVFKNRVVQFFADNLQDVNGNITTLYETIAKDVFGETPGICFCTDTEEKVGPSD